MVVSMVVVRKLSRDGSVEQLYSRGDRTQGLEKSPVKEIALTFSGIIGDAHGGQTRASDSRTLKLYPRKTDIRNVRQVTLVSVEDLQQIAEMMGLDRVEAPWLGANILVSGLPHFTLLPPSSRLQFPSGATLVVDMQNEPCRQVADVIAAHVPDIRVGFVAAARQRRGVTAWVEREGPISLGDRFAVWVPAQPAYPET